jgi:hypothetical protein
MKKLQFLVINGQKFFIFQINTEEQRVAKILCMHFVSEHVYKRGANKKNLHKAGQLFFAVGQI